MEGVGRLGGQVLAGGFLAEGAVFPGSNQTHRQCLTEYKDENIHGCFIKEEKGSSASWLSPETFGRIVR